jgi:hypothetical protein
VISAARVAIVAALASLLWILAAGPLVPACGLTAAAAVVWCRWLDVHPEPTAEDPHD